MKGNKIKRLRERQMGEDVESEMFLASLKMEGLEVLEAAFERGNDYYTAFTDGWGALLQQWDAQNSFHEDILLRDISENRRGH